MQTKKYFFIILLFMLLTCFGMQTRMPAFAGTDDNVSGWAWNSNVGWISFNSTGCDADCNGSPCTHDGTCPLSGDYKDYGVSIDPSTGEFSGYAWNNNVGWISFQQSETPPDNYIFNSNCNTGFVCNAPASCTACYNSNNHNIYGWAKILSMGDDGWIRFDFNEGSIDPTGEDYEAKIADGQLTGWAWNGNEGDTGIGWISLNCNSLDAGGCLEGKTYTAFADLNAPPIISDMSAPNWNYDQVCAHNTALIADLKWKYNDDSGKDGTAYRIKVTGSDLSIFDTDQCLKDNGPSGKCNIDFETSVNLSCLEENKYCTYTLDKSIFSYMDYGVTYNWEITVWDDADSPATFSGTPFTTYLSEFPNPDNFTWSPSNFSIDEVVLLSSEGNAKYYTGGVENDCDTNHCTWEWSDNSGLGNINFTDDTASSTDATFNSADSELRLTVTDTTDGKNYSCASTTKFNVNKKLPTWIEAR